MQELSLREKERPVYCDQQPLSRWVADVLGGPGRGQARMTSWTARRLRSLVPPVQSTTTVPPRPPAADGRLNTISKGKTQSVAIINSL